jgi:centrosomal protein CEP57
VFDKLNDALPLLIRSPSLPLPDVHEKLTAAEQRCQLLERQLDHMRKLVQGAESKASHAATRTELLRQHRADEDEADIRARLAKINALEREHLKLTATQAIAEVRGRS